MILYLSDRDLLSKATIQLGLLRLTSTVKTPGRLHYLKTPPTVFFSKPPGFPTPGEGFFPPPSLTDGPSS